MRKSNVALRLQTSLLEEAKRVAEAEGVALNQLINVAVAEKLSALRTEEYFREIAPGLWAWTDQRLDVPAHWREWPKSRWREAPVDPWEGRLPIRLPIGRKIPSCPTF